MTDRCAVLTTHNGKVVEWKMFESKMHGIQYYSEGIDKLSDIMTHNSDDRWEVLLCDVNQFARSFSETEAEDMTALPNIQDSDVLFSE